MIHKLHATRLATLLLAVSTSACASSRLYGPKSCEPDGHTQAAYPTANGEAAVCLPREHVAFMLCARELGLASMATDNGVKATVEVKVPNVGDVGKGEVGVTDKKDAKWAGEGEVAKARADMMRACLDMLTKARPPVATK